MEYLSTAHQFSDKELKSLAQRFKMLSEVSRLKILRSLSEGEKCVTDIINATGLLQANVSKQLRMLEMDGVVLCRPQGLMRYYSVTDQTLLLICSQMCKIIDQEN